MTHDALPSVTVILCLAAPASAGDAALRFVDVSAESGIGPLRMLDAMGGGAAAADFDDDGDIDLFVPNTEGAPDQLYRNLGDGTFEEIAEAAGVAFTGRSRVALFFDYDGDHRLDLFVASDCQGEGSDCAKTTTLRLYRQVSDARFVDVTVECELPDDEVEGRSSHRSGVAAGDLNGDGHLDLLVGLWFGRTRVFLNDGDGTFTDAGEASGIGGPHDNPWQPFIHDFSRDGRADVYVSVDFNVNHMWINRGGMTFVDEARDRGCDNDWNDMGVAGGDYDNDGDLDLYITNISGGNRRNVLYRNDWPVFADVTVNAGCGEGGWGWGCTFIDADNDGRLDIAATNGWKEGRHQNDPSRFYWNAGGDPVTFDDLSAEVGFDDMLWGSSLLAFDADRDGDLDLVQICNGTGTHPAATRLLLNEPAHDNHHLVIKPRMKGRNARAIGAVVRVTAGDNKDKTTMMRVLTAGTSFLGQEPAEAFFGLGRATVADRVVIEWPDNRTTELTDVAADQVLTVLQVIAADLDEDGRVGFSDIMLMLVSWGKCGECPADLNHDGVVDGRDLMLMFADWG